MMEFEQFVPGALPATGSDGSGDQTRVTRLRRRPRPVVIACFVLIGVLAGCGEAIVEPVTVATPTPIVGDASQLPDTPDGDNTTPIPDAADAEPPTIGPPARLIDTVVPVQDMHGNIVTIHQAQPWPESYEALRPLGTGFSLAGDLDEQFALATSLVAIDVSVCAPTLGDVDVATGAGTFTLGNDQAVPLPAAGNGSLTSSDMSLVPAFMWPDLGACSRGWVAIATTADLSAGLFAHYRPAADDAGERVLAWSVRPDRRQLSDTTQSFGAGQTVTFNGGELAGATVAVDGWAELVGAPIGAPGTRPVGLSVQSCPSASGVSPTLGLSVDGWNLAEATARTVDGIDALDGSGTACDTGWLIFDVPHGGRVDGAFVAEQPGTPGAHWSLLGAALPDPT